MVIECLPCIRPNLAPKRPIFHARTPFLGWAIIPNPVSSIQAGRDYGFQERSWTGPRNHPSVSSVSSDLFLIGVPDDWKGRPAGDAVFAGLNTNQSTVGIITRSPISEPLRKWILENLQLRLRAGIEAQFGWVAAVDSDIESGYQFLISYL